MTAPPEPDVRGFVLRRTSKEVVRIRLDDAPPTLIRPELTADPVEVRPSLCDITMTSVDGETWAVHGVTVAGEGLRGAGRYYRRRLADGTWQDDTPRWVMRLAWRVSHEGYDDAGPLQLPAYLCVRCGYACEPDGPDAWVHVRGSDASGHLPVPWEVED